MSETKQGFVDFDDCVDHMSQRYDEDTAKRICKTICDKYGFGSAGSASVVQNILSNFKKLVQALMRSKTAEYPNGYPEDVAETIARSIVQDQASLSFSYLSNLGELKEEQGKLIVPIHIISEGENLNQWGVTDESRRKNAETLKTAVLLGPPDEDHPGTISGGPPGAPHEGMWYPIQGQIIDYISNGATYGIASIEDPYAIEKIKNKEWGPVSPSVSGLAHQTEDGDTLFLDFQFDHILFLPKDERPAYPKAGVKDWIEQAKQPESFEVALQAALESFTVTPISGETDGNMKPLGTRLKTPIHPQVPEKQRGRSESKMKDSKDNQPSIEELQATVESQAKMIEDLQVDLKSLKESSKVPTEKKQAAEDKKIIDPEVDAKLKSLQAFADAVSKREHASLVAAVLEAEKQAGMITDEKTEKKELERLQALTNETLLEIKGTTERAAAYIGTLPGAKKPETFEESEQAADLKERVRMQLFGHRHDKDGREVT